MRKLYFILTCNLAVGSSFSQQLDMPTISTASGIYTTDIVVSMTHPEPGVTLFYTLNGSEPTPFSPIYSSAITLSSRNGDANNYSAIPTNPSFTYPVGDYTETRANNRGWLPPLNEIFKVNILRVKAFKAGFVPSTILTKTIIIDPGGTGIYDMPILSFVVDSIDLFSNNTGIYHYGAHVDGNYTQKGAAWERLAHLDYFDQSGALVIEQNVRTRMHGGGSRHSTKKTFRVYAEHDGNTNFNYPFFDDHQLAKYKRILIRSGGHRPDCFPRDDLGNLITAGLNTDQQHFKHVILFLNGEYWGIHSIKERIDKYFLQNQYGIDDNDITVLDQEYDVQDGHAADSLLMVEIETRADTSDMTDPVNYQYITDRIDIENYIDYMGSEIFLSNEDWVYSNVVIWRKTGAFNPTASAGQDGKFRWLLYDLDGAFGGSCNNAYYTVNTLENATVNSGIYSTYTRLFRGLLGNDDFRTEFINRECDLMNSHFKASVLHDKMDLIYAQLLSEMPENVDRWRYPSEATTLLDRQSEIPTLVQWDTSFYYLNRFADRRQRKVREHIMAKWGYPDTSYVTIDVNDQTMGSVKINSLLINDQLPGVEVGIYPWQGIYIDSIASQLVAVPMPGYEFVEWQESGDTNDTISWTPNGDSTFTAVFQTSASYQPVVINEVMPSNSLYLEDNFGDNDDWLELFNPNTYPVHLSNCTLTRDAEVWTIPNGTVIDPNGYLLFWMDNELYQGSDHASFKLFNANHTVYLKSPTGTIIDFMAYPQTATDNSFGRYPNGSASFNLFTYPTPRENNDISSTKENPAIMNALMGYPNPAKNQMQLNKIISYRLYSLDGKLVQSASQSNVINLNNIDSGTYVLLSDAGETLKVIVRK